MKTPELLGGGEPDRNAESVEFANLTLLLTFGRILLTLILTVDLTATLKVEIFGRFLLALLAKIRFIGGGAGGTPTHFSFICLIKQIKKI